MPALAIQDWPLPYEERLAARPSSAIDLVVIHCTELPDMTMAREFGERIHYAGTRTGNSGHYYIDLDGKVFRFVADNRVANHTFGYNPRSIGIELVNIGRYPHWGDSRYQTFTEAYTQAQIDALRALLRAVAQRPPEPALDRRPRGSGSAPRTGQRRPGQACCRDARIRGRCSRGLRCWTAADSNDCYRNPPDTSDVVAKASRLPALLPRQENLMSPGGSAGRRDAFRDTGDRTPSARYTCALFPQPARP